MSGGIYRNPTINGFGCGVKTYAGFANEGTELHCPGFWLISSPSIRINLKYESYVIKWMLDQA